MPACLPACIGAETVVAQSAPSCATVQNTNHTHTTRQTSCWSALALTRVYVWVMYYCICYSYREQQQHSILVSRMLVGGWVGYLLLVLWVMDGFMGDSFQGTISHWRPASASSSKRTSARVLRGDRRRRNSRIALIVLLAAKKPQTSPTMFVCMEQ